MSTTEESFTGSSSTDRPDIATHHAGDLEPSHLEHAHRPFPATSPVRAGEARSRRRGFTTAMFILGAALVGGLLAWLWATSQGERYSATAVVQLEPSGSIEDSRDVVDVVGNLDRGPTVVTAAGVATSGVVTGAAQARIGLSPTQAEDYEVESLQVLTSHLIDITVTGPNEVQAVAYADAVAEELATSFADSYSVYQIRLVTPATVPDSSGRPGAMLIVIAAMIASAVGATMLWLALFGGSDERTDLPLARRS